MSNTITIAEPNVNTLMATYAGIQLERASTQTGTFSLVARISYVTNQTQYSYVDAVGLSTDWYRSARYLPSLALAPYSPPWPVLGVAGAGQTLQQYRRRLGEAAGFLSLYQTTVGASRADQVVVADLISGGALESSFLSNSWVYQPTGVNALQARRVAYNGLDPTTGTLSLDRAFGAQTPINTPLEVYGRLPPVRMEGRLGLNDLVNKVLSECWTIQKLPLAGVQNQRVYPVGSSMPWLVSEDQIVEVYFRPAAADPNADDSLMVNWRWVPGGDNPGIEIAQTLSTGDTLLPQVYVPMSWWIDQGIGFGIPSAEGLLAESDRGILPLIGMEVIGSAWIYQELGKWGLPDDQATYRQLRAQARAAANQWKRLSLEHPKVRKQHWPAVLTVRSRENYGSNYAVVTPGA